MSNKKKQIRANFRNNTFKRDNYCCRVCGFVATPETAEDILDCHHITPRENLPNGGYVKENGISLCKGEKGMSCHEKAEAYLIGENQDENYSPTTFYAMIGSSLEKAEASSLKL